MSTIPKAVFGLQRLARDPIIQRRLARETRMSPTDLRDRVLSLTSTRDPFFNTVKQVIDETNNEDR